MAKYEYPGFKKMSRVARKNEVKGNPKKRSGDDKDAELREEIARTVREIMLKSKN